MKKFIWPVLLLASLTVAAQKNYNVVFDLTSRDSLTQQSVVRWVGEIMNANPDAHVEVVMYGQGLNLAVRGKSSVEDAVYRYAANPNVSFRVCNVAMQHQHIEKADLIKGVQIVPDGIYEIISKQREGWGYIKAVH
jgi:intracellular sulfur oxidation DsrE/DsrF family protein